MDPTFVDLPADTWTKVASGVVAGVLHRVSTRPNVYLQTTRDAGGVAPTLRTEGVKVFVGEDAAEISAGSQKDIYLYPVGVAGRVRVDL